MPIHGQFPPEFYAPPDQYGRYPRGYHPHQPNYRGNRQQYGAYGDGYDARYYQNRYESRGGYYQQHEDYSAGGAYEYGSGVRRFMGGYHAEQEGYQGYERRGGWSRGRGGEMQNRDKEREPPADPEIERTRLESTGSETDAPKERKKLELKPRTKPLASSDENEGAEHARRSIFGGAKPVDTTQREKEIEEKIQQDVEEEKVERERVQQNRFSANVGGAGNRTRYRTSSQMSGTSGVESVSSGAGSVGVASNSQQQQPIKILSRSRSSASADLGMKREMDEEKVTEISAADNKEWSDTKTLSESDPAINFSSTGAKASEYERAAICYKNARKLPECRQCYLKASEHHENNGILFHAAKCKENAALLSRDLGEMDKAKELMLKASQQYAETGTPETSTQALDKAAKFLESVDPDSAIEVYLKAYQIVQETDRTRQASQFLDRLTKLYLKSDPPRLDEAATNIKSEIDMYTEVREGSKVGRLTSGLVLVHLLRGDSVEADKAYQASFSCEGFAQTEDAMTLGSLISAFETGDKEKLQNCLSRPHMKSMDNEIRGFRPFTCPLTRLDCRCHFLRIIKKLEPPKVEKKMEIETTEDDLQGAGEEENEDEDLDLR